MSNISKYQKIYNLVAIRRCSDEELKSMKQRYSEIVNSKRRLECIGSLVELLRVLEKRDYLSPNNIERLIELAKLFKEFSNMNFTSEENNLNESHGSNFNVANRTGVRAENQRILPRIPKHPKERAYQCIATEIGQKWPYLARALSVPEGYIDDLNAHRTIPSRVYEILTYYEESCEPQTFLSGLLEALKDARRNDLRLKVQRIFDYNS